MGRTGSSSQLYSTTTPEHSPKALKAAELETKKLAIKAKHTEEFVYHSRTVQELAIGSALTAIGGTGDELQLSKAGSSKEGSGSSSKDKKGRRKKKQTRAAESHRFSRLKATNYGRCKICDNYVYFWGLECTQVSDNSLRREW